MIAIIVNIEWWAKFSGVLFLLTMIVVFVVMVLVDLFSVKGLRKHSDSYKRKHGLCWRYECMEKVNSCRAGPEWNGPMCDRHCGETMYHRTCNTSEEQRKWHNAMLMMGYGDLYTHEIRVQGKRLDEMKRLKN